MDHGNRVDSEFDLEQTILEVSNLSVKLKDSIILDRLNFKVPRGSIVAIVGPNGAGKTTLFRALMNLIPYTGTIRWKVGIRMGYVPQNLVVTDIPITVEEFLRFKCRTELSSCLNLVGLKQEILGSSLGTLSGGQLQRVLLAWSIVDFPEVLLFDEPTTGVDVGAEEPIYEKVRELKKELGITVLLITHNHHVVAHYSDYVLSLNRRQLFFGKTSSIVHTQMVSLMIGEVPESISEAYSESVKET